jgi:hypothetical protein
VSTRWAKRKNKREKERESAKEGERVWQYACCPGGKRETAGKTGLLFRPGDTGDLIEKGGREREKERGLVLPSSNHDRRMATNSRKGLVG